MDPSAETSQGPELTLQHWAKAKAPESIGW